MDDAQALQQPRNRLPGPGAGRPDGAPAEQPAAQPEALPAATAAALAGPRASPPADDDDVAADADGAAAEDDDAASQQGGGARQRKARRPMRPFPPAQQESGLSTLVDRLNDTICTMHLRCGVEVHVVIVRNERRNELDEHVVSELATPGLRCLSERYPAVLSAAAIEVDSVRTRRASDQAVRAYDQPVATLDLQLVQKALLSWLTTLVHDRKGTLAWGEPEGAARVLLPWWPNGIPWISPLRMAQANARKVFAAASTAMSEEQMLLAHQDLMRRQKAKLAPVQLDKIDGAVRQRPQRRQQQQTHLQRMWRSRAHLQDQLQARCSIYNMSVDSMLSLQ